MSPTHSPRHPTPRAAASHPPALERKHCVIVTHTRSYTHTFIHHINSFILHSSLIHDIMTVPTYLPSLPSLPYRTMTPSLRTVHTLSSPSSFTHFTHTLHTSYALLLHFTHTHTKYSNTFTSRTPYTVHLTPYTFLVHLTPSLHAQEVQVMIEKDLSSSSS